MNVLKWYVSEDKPWFKHYQEGVPKHPEFPAISLGDWFDKKTEENSKNKAIWFSKTFMTYRVLRKYTDSLATSLSRQGIKKSDVIAILLPNSFQFTIAYFATVKLGGIVVPINPTYKPLEILNVLKQVKPKALICMDAMYGLIKPIQDKYKFEFIISTCIVDLAAIPPAIKEQLITDGTIPTGDVPDSINFLDVCQKRGEVDIPDVEIDPINDTAVYLMTGGTTGVPKPAVITHFNCVTNAKQNVMWMPDATHPMACVGILPMFHAFGMTIVQNVVIEGGDYNILFPRPPQSLKDVIDTILEVGPEKGVEENLTEKILGALEAVEYSIGDLSNVLKSRWTNLDEDTRKEFEKRWYEECNDTREQLLNIYKDPDAFLKSMSEQEQKHINEISETVDLSELKQYETLFPWIDIENLTLGDKVLIYKVASAVIFLM